MNIALLARMFCFGTDEGEVYLEKCIAFFQRYLKENEIFAGFVGKSLDWWKVLVAEAPTAKHMHPI